MYRIDEIEDAIIARLQDQLSYLRTCASLGEIPSDDADLEALVARGAAVYVVHTSGEYDHSASGTQDVTMEFELLCMTRNLRGEDKARRGQGTEKGAYTLLNDVRAALTEQACGLTIDPLLPSSHALVGMTASLAAYAIRFGTRCRFSTA